MSQSLSTSGWVKPREYQQQAVDFLLEDDDLVSFIDKLHETVSTVDSDDILSNIVDSFNEDLMGR